MRVIRNIRYKYDCNNCEGVEDDDPTVSIARMPEQMIPKSMATAGLLAHIMTAKFADALPFYRQEKQFSRIGVDLPGSTMCSWAMKVAQAMTADEFMALMPQNVDKTLVAGPAV